MSEETTKDSKITKRNGELARTPAHDRLLLIFALFVFIVVSSLICVICVICG